MLFPAQGQWTLILAVGSCAVSEEAKDRPSGVRERSCGRGWHSEKLAVVSGTCEREMTEKHQGHACGGGGKPARSQTASRAARQKRKFQNANGPNRAVCSFPTERGSTYRGGADERERGRLRTSWTVWEEAENKPMPNQNKKTKTEKRIIQTRQLLSHGRAMSETQASRAVW